MEEGNILRVGGKGTHGFFIHRAKEILKDQETIELHGLGFAINNTVRASEALCSMGYTELAKFETHTIEEVG